MIGIILENEAFEQDIRELLMAFYPGETFVHERNAEVSFYVEGSLNPEQTSYRLRLTRGTGGAKGGMDADTAARMADETAGGTKGLDGPLEEELKQVEEPIRVNWFDRAETKNQIKRRLYALLFRQTGRELPWGSLTGIRPTKIAMSRLAAGETPDEIRRGMQKTSFTSREKADLCIDTAVRERRLLSALDYENGYSLYVGIPFCPTTCLYCSFTSFPIGKWRGRTPLYLEALFKEMEYVSRRMKDKKLDTVYIGGGTPTSLPAEDLERLMERIHALFPCGQALEFTVEAGRPDSITDEKLKVLKSYGITRISINPQTMNQKTLDLIGRRHTTGQVRECFHMARDMGFDNINMDLIVGLPEETLEDVEHTLDQVRRMGPDSLTVHSLAVKRAARLNTMKEQYEGLSMINTPEMIARTAGCAAQMGMEPYYLYRQKNMAGNFENVGYSKPGKACIYNILIMEELQTIMACGAGTTTKLVYPAENRHERTENVKDVDQYIARLDEMIERKEKKLLAKPEKTVTIEP